MENSDSKNVNKQQLKRARLTALILASVIVFSLLTLIYAFMQKMEADKARADAEVIGVQLKQMETEAMQNRAEAEKQKTMAEEQRMMALVAEQRAMQALAECDKKKKSK